MRADLSGETLDRVVKEIVVANGKALGEVHDVSDERKARILTERSVSEFGRLDAAYTNAGIQVPTADLPVEDFDRVNRRQGYIGR